MKVKTEETFDAAHKLEKDEGKCGNLHGHRWRVIVEAEGLRNDRGMVFDFRHLDNIIDEYDHSFLNEEIDAEPTAENIAFLILKKLVNKYDDIDFTVRVYESPKSYAEVSTIED